MDSDTIPNIKQEQRRGYTDEAEEEDDDLDIG